MLHPLQTHQVDHLLQQGFPVGLGDGLTALPLQLHVFESTDSTNQRAWDLVEQGHSEGTVAIALEQTTGRGQWGRQWQSNRGGLYLSIVLTPNLPAHQSGQLTLFTAWGLAIALQQIGISINLKWPNDLVVNRLKLGGVLTETRIRQGKIAIAVVGIGINWNNTVPDTAITLKDLIAQGAAQYPLTTLEEVVALTLQGVRYGYHHWQHSGIDTILPSYQALLIGLGQTVQVEGGEGTVVGVTPTGHLLIQRNGADDERMVLPPGAVRLGY